MEGPLSEQQAREQSVMGVANEILEALATVSDAASEALSQPESDLSMVLANPSNMMVGDARPERAIRARKADDRKHLARLQDDPFVARVKVKWEGGGPAETYFFSRGPAAALTKAVKNASLTSQLMKLGALAEHEVGETATIETPGGDREALILERSIFSPENSGGLWDASLSNFEIEKFGEIAELLLAKFLRIGLSKLSPRDAEPIEIEDIVGRSRADAAAKQDEQKRLRRKVVERIALRDRPVLDKFQGEIFRLPLDHQVVLFGPPGAGKTTTLIKRLAQKRTLEALTDKEKAVVSDFGDERFIGNWAMFSPTELLKEYLGDAFNKEGIPDAGNVRTWDRERHNLARNVFGILRSGKSGRYQHSDMSIIADAASTSVSALHDDFAAYAEAALVEDCNNALRALLPVATGGIRRLVLALSKSLLPAKKFSFDDLLRFLDGTDGWQAEIKAISAVIATDLNKTVNLLLNKNKELISELARAAPTLRSAADDEADEDADEMEQPVAPIGNSESECIEMLMAAIRTWSRAVAEGRRIGGRAGRVIALVGNRMPAPESVMTLGNNIALRTTMRTFVQAPRKSVMGLSEIYARFRRQAVKEGRHFITDKGVASYISRNLISDAEIDVVLLVMLRHARRLSLFVARRRIDLKVQHDWLAKIQSSYLTQVFVDEATDLSAVQLACTVELSDPALRSWFACGDLRQRITAHGIANEAELEWLNRTAEINVDVRNINVGYRQSQRLRELSDTMASLLNGVPLHTEASKGSDEANDMPLLGEHLSGKGAAEWLAARIGEVEDRIGSLPSIAIFVDGDELMDDLVRDLRPLLETRNIPVAGCKGGKVVGDAREVRIFDVQHIKGLEFEAVFFVGIDRLAKRIPDLFLRFVYVGVTRAATFLAVTCENKLPPKLKKLRPQFGREGWPLA